MRKSGFVFLVVISALMLAACERSASQAPVLPQATVAGTSATGGEPAATDQMSILQTYATQTAMAEGGQPVVATETPASPDAATQDAAAPTSTPDGSVPQLPSPTATVAAPIATPIPVGSVPPSYTLQQGEFPYCIARRYNINPDELLSLNGLTDSGILQPGLTLKIPQTGNPFPASRALLSHPTTYTVGLNDTIYSIACKFGDVSPEQIAAANGLTAPYKLTVGQAINIP